MWLREIIDYLKSEGISGERGFCFLFFLGVGEGRVGHAKAPIYTGEIRKPYTLPGKDGFSENT